MPLPCPAHLVGLYDGANEREEHVGLKGSQATRLHHSLQPGNPATRDQPRQLVGREGRGGEGRGGEGREREEGRGGEGGIE